MIYLDVLDDEGKTTLLGLDGLADLCDEAALELELSAPRVSFRLFDAAKRLRTTWGVTGLGAPAAAPACGVEPVCCPGCGGAGCPACKC